MKKVVSIFLLALSLKSGAQVNLTTGLTACYALDGNAIEPVNALTGTLSMVTPTVNRFGSANSACYFNGQTSSYIELPNNSLLKPNQFSFSTWVNVPAITSQMTIVFTKNTYASYHTAYSLFINTGSAYHFAVCRQDGTTSDFVYGTSSVLANTWYHVAFSLDNAGMKLYVNGVLENTTVPGIMSFNYDSSSNVILGGTNGIANYPYTGSMDNTRFYNRILSNSEVAALFEMDSTCADVKTGITTNQGNKNRMNIYPNPTSGKFTVDNAKGEIGSYQVLDLLGSLIFESNFTDLEKQTVDLSTHPNGVYFLKIRNEEFSKTIKIVKE